MYENGRKVSRYHRMREHKRRMKDRFLKNPKTDNVEMGKSYQEYLVTTNEKDRTEPFGCRGIPYAQQYWRHAYCTNDRQRAKKDTAAAARNNWKNALSKFNGEEWEDFEGGQEYNKLINFEAD